MLKVYGHPANQPARSVFWACLLHDLPFTLHAPLGAPPVAVNPRGQVPGIDDDGFMLAECAAIAAYLARKHGWHAFYPEDLQVRARIDQWMHMYHSLVRLATSKLMVTHVVKPVSALSIGNSPLSIGTREPMEVAFAAEDGWEHGQPFVRAICEHLENDWFDGGGAYLCGTANPTPADLIGYSELGQLRIANLFDFSPFVQVQAWLDAMGEVPHHDAVQAYNLTLGDIRSAPNTMERFNAASRAGVQALVETGLVNVER